MAILKVKFPSFMKVSTLVCATMLASCSGAENTTSKEGSSIEALAKTKKTDIPTGKLPEWVEPSHYELHLKTDAEEERYSGKVTITLQLKQVSDHIWLHGLGHTVEAAKLEHASGDVFSARYEEINTNGLAKLSFDSQIEAGKYKLSIPFEAAYNQNLVGLYSAPQNGKGYLATQMEAIDARKAFPGFDEPRFKTPYKVSVVAPKDQKVITNGALVESREMEEGWVLYEFAETRPLPSYLIAFAIGPYDINNGRAIPGTAERPEIPLRGVAAKGKGPQTAQSIEDTHDILTWMEGYFDYPYPYGKLDLIAAPDFAYGAMENAGAIIYRESRLLVDSNTPLSQLRAYEVTHAHELAHLWFGDLVTPVWWDDIWLNEAFATWMSYKSLVNVWPEKEYDLAVQRSAHGAMLTDSLYHTRQIRQPIERDGDINDGFDSITYRKGGGVLNMFENFVGEDNFRAGVRLHMRRFEDGVATTEDFMQSIADGAEEPRLVSAFTSFIAQPGLPLVSVEMSCDEDQGKVTYNFRQSRFAPLGSKIDTGTQTWQIPVNYKTPIGGVYGDQTLQSQLFLDEAAITETVPTNRCPDWIMPNAGGAGYYRFALEPDLWMALFENIKSLTPAEQLSLADSMMAEFLRGQIPMDLMWEGVMALAEHGDWQSVDQILGALSYTANMVLEDGDDEIFRMTIGKMLAKRLESLKAQDTLSNGEQLLAENLTRFLAVDMQMADYRTDLKARAEHWAGLADNGFGDSALQPGYAAPIMTIGMQDLGEAFYEAAFQRIAASPVQGFRSRALGALASGADKVTGPRLLAQIFAEDSGVTSREAFETLSNLAANRAVAKEVWADFKARFDELIPYVPGPRLPRVPLIASGFCSSEMRDEAEAFFSAKADQIPGYERTLAQTLERIELCTAQKQAFKGVFEP